MTGDSHRRPFVVVLTGGIASGKTAVSERFARLGVPVVDTDVIARELVQPGEPALAAIVDEFGAEVLDEQGRLTRTRMREIIFRNPESKRKLEAILHPSIGAQAMQRIHSLDCNYCILVVPLLAESGSYQWADRILVVDVDEETQIARLEARDRVSRKQAESALRAQSSRRQRLKLADDVIENSGDLQALDLAVLGLHEKYSALADHKSHTSLP